MTWAFAKAILLGEHAVVYGHPALAGALSAKIHIDNTGPNDTASIDIEDWKMRVSASDNNSVGQALRLAFNLCQVPPAALHGRSDIPPSAGLGSSAALSVATVRCLRPEWDAAQVCETANKLERCFHDNPSGVDVALACYGGLGSFSKSAGFEPISTEGLRGSGIPLLVAVSGEERSTAEQVRMVAEKMAARETATNTTNTTDAIDAIDAMGGIAAKGILDIRHGNTDNLADYMDEAQRNLETLGLCSPGIRRLIDIATEGGGRGVKLSGAGGGGAVIALAQSAGEGLLASWRENGFLAFACTLGAH